MCPIVSGRAGDDAIVIFGVALSFHQGLPATVGARAEVGPLRRVTIECLHNRFPLHRCLVNRAMTVVDDLLGMVERPARVRSPGLMSCIRGGGSVAFAYCAAKTAVADSARESSVADAEEFSVP